MPNILNPIDLADRRSVVRSLPCLTLPGIAPTAKEAKVVADARGARSTKFASSSEAGHE
jgi:hypothetical protein